MSSLYPKSSEKKKYSFLQKLKRRFIEFQYYVKASIDTSNLPQQKFVIYGQGRTGSELLCKLLDLNPDIQCDTEILFHHLFFPQLLIKGKLAACHQNTYGFKVKIYQLQDIQNQDPEKFLQQLLADGWKIIYLKRENLLRHGLSLITARQRKKFHVPAGNNKVIKQKVKVDCNLLLAQIKDREEYQQADEKLLSNLPHLTIVYEQDLLNEENHQSTVDKICDYLGITSVAVKAPFARLTPDNLADLIENHQEVIEMLNQTKYAHFLADKPSLISQ